MIAIDLDGHVVQALRDRARRYITATGVLEHDGSLYIGSVAEPAVARLPLTAPRAGPIDQ